jgi:hypothetical protein
MDCLHLRCVVIVASRKGGKSGSDVTCKECKGQGIVIRIRQLGPGMIQQVTSAAHYTHSYVLCACEQHSVCVALDVVASRFKPLATSAMVKVLP